MRVFFSNARCSFIEFQHNPPFLLLHVGIDQFCFLWRWSMLHYHLLLSLASAAKNSLLTSCIECDQAWLCIADVLKGKHKLKWKEVDFLRCSSLQVRAQCEGSLR